MPVPSLPVTRSVVFTSEHASRVPVPDAHSRIHTSPFGLYPDHETVTNWLSESRVEGSIVTAGPAACAGSARASAASSDSTPAAAKSLRRERSRSSIEPPRRSDTSQLSAPERGSQRDRRQDQDGDVQRDESEWGARSRLDAADGLPNRRL